MGEREKKTFIKRCRDLIRGINAFFVLNFIGTIIELSRDGRRRRLSRKVEIISAKYRNKIK